jgi:hypothetical protein
MKLYSIWQPLASEDARTALVFGFLRHAPVEHGLAPWLTDVLGRPVTATPLEPENFWPRFASRLEDHEWTEPELVIEAADGDPLVVVVEAKPGYGMHRQEQLTRELIDSAHAASAKRVALIAVGADIGDPIELDQWRTAARAGLDAHGLRSTDVEIHYSSWARLGARIEECSRAFPALRTYAEDALAQLHFNALLGYKGAPMLDDLDEMTLMNAFVAFNRALLSAREFFLRCTIKQAFEQSASNHSAKGTTCGATAHRLR